MGKGDSLKGCTDDRCGVGLGRGRTGPRGSECCILGAARHWAGVLSLPMPAQVLSTCGKHCLNGEEERRAAPRETQSRADNCYSHLQERETAGGGEPGQASSLGA